MQKHLNSPFKILQRQHLKPNMMKLRSKSSFSFFGKMTSSRKKLSFPRSSKMLDTSEINRMIDNASEIILKWNVSESKFYSLFCENNREAKKYVRRVKDLQNAIDSLIREDLNSRKLLRAQKLMQTAMKRLQSEFNQILSINRAHFDPESASSKSPNSVISNNDYIWSDSSPSLDSVIEIQEVSKKSRTELKSIAECMIAAGYAKECASIYKSIRKSIVDEAIYHLGVEKMSSSKAKKMEWEDVDFKMMMWIEAVKISMKTLFTSEKSLCNEIFDSSACLKESCFRDIVKEGALLLFGFPETVAVRDKKNPHPEKIFPLLDLYCTITEHLLAIDSIFSFPSISAVRTQALNSLTRLSESILTHLEEFESEIGKDSSKTVIPGGGVHPMTINAMDHLSRLADYSNVLMDILNRSSTSSSAKSLLPKSYFNVSEIEESSAMELRARFALLILVLLGKIDSKSEMYKEFSLQYLFLANNLQHVVSRARYSNLKQLLGEEWIAKHVEKVRQFTRSYERLAWDPLVSMCPKISTSEAVDMSEDEAEWQFRIFNHSFEITCESQSKCIVSDPELQDEMMISISRMLLPLYRDFYNAHRNAVMLAGREGEWNVKYTPEDIENLLAELFSGNGVSGNQYMCTSTFCLVTPPHATRGHKKRSLSCQDFERGTKVFS